MKALRLLRPGLNLEMCETELPVFGPDEVLIEVKAAGICHSDAHYRAGRSKVEPLPLTLGHEVSGVIAGTGPEVSGFKAGDRVCVHYLATCGQCRYCLEGHEQFCLKGQMIGKHRDGGFAQFIRMPDRSVFALPDGVSFEHGAVLMCSSATSLHALRKARLRAGETVAVFGAGGLGLSAIQLAKAFAAGGVFAVDINAEKLRLARRLGAVPVDASARDPVVEIRRLTGNRGVDVALELIGLPVTMRQAVLSLAIKGRAALAGITEGSLAVAPYHELINKEAEIVGVSDHLAKEVPLLLELAATGKLNLSEIVTNRVPLEAKSVNQVLDQLEQFGGAARTVIVP